MFSCGPGRNKNATKMHIFLFGLIEFVIFPFPKLGTLNGELPSISLDIVGVVDRTAS